jgi:hypothetical protein
VTAQLFGSLSAVDWLNVVSYGADPTGINDSAPAINAALAALPAGGGTVYLPAGTYKLSSATTPMGLGQYLRGAGMSATTVKLASAAGAVPALTVTAPGGSVSQFAGIRDLTVDITGAASGATGVQAGNILQLQLRDVYVRGASGFGNNGIHFLNNNSHTEQASVRAYVSGCDNPVTFDVTGSDPSFDRGDFEFFIDQFNPNGNGIAWINGALQRGGSLKVRGNFSAGVTNTGKVLAFSGTGAVLARVQFDVSVETDGSGTGPQTINFGAGSNTIDGYGSADFLNSGGSFQASNNNGQFALTGRVSGDTSLQTEISAATYTIISSGFPSGWSGTVKLEKMPGQDQVFILVSLAIASGTVVTAPETLLTGIAAPFAPAANNQHVAMLLEDNGAFSGCGLALTTAGALLYEGPTFTAAGTSAVQGSGVYSNSQ